MAAAAGIVPRRLAVVQPKVRDYFTDAAQAILDGDDSLEQIANALALVAGKVQLVERSLLTGEDHMTTLALTATDGTPLTPCRDQLVALTSTSCWYASESSSSPAAWLSSPQASAHATSSACWLRSLASVKYALKSSSIMVR